MLIATRISPRLRGASHADAAAAAAAAAVVDPTSLPLGCSLALSLPAAPGRAGAATWVAHLVPESWRSTGWVGSIRPWSRLPASFDRCEAQAEPVFVAARSPFLVVESTLVPLASVAGVSW